MICRADGSKWCRIESIHLGAQSIFWGVLRADKGNRTAAEDSRCMASTLVDKLCNLTASYSFCETSVEPLPYI